MFAVKLDKGDFIGREAVLRRREVGPTRRLVQFALEDPEPLLYHNEPISRDGTIVGRTSSGAYGHTLGRAVALGYVEGRDVTPDLLAAGRWEIEVAGRRFAARASLAPLYDAKGQRLRS